MDHLVKFRTAEGRDGTHTCATLDEALKFVERLRNTEDASQVRVFRMHEVPIEFKTYYKVEVKAADEVPAAPPASLAADDAAARPLVATAAPGSADTDADAGRRRFSRG